MIQALALPAFPIPALPSKTQASSITTPFRTHTILKLSNSRDYTTRCNQTASIELESAVEVVRQFYDAFSRYDMASVEKYFALNCVYEDLIFSHPFLSRTALLEYFKQFDFFTTDLRFVIDDITEAEEASVGVIWHVDWRGKVFPFCRGCSFYRLDIINGKRQIVYGRDSVEPAIKPGNSALVVIRVLTWLLQNFPFLVNHLRSK